MKLSRNITNRVNWILDHLVPPFVRDSKFFMTPIFYIFFGNKYKKFMDFKAVAWKLTPQAMEDYYKDLIPYHIKRETDLGSKSVNFILNNILGNKVLDISCGRGFLSKKIKKKIEGDVIGVDFIISDDLKSSLNPKFVKGTIEKIPFPDNHFNTVICTHTLEHIVNINLAISELRRVCKQRLIIVVPRQRNYKYTFDLHVQFFPHQHSLLDTMGHRGEIICLQNDWVYKEDTFNS